MLDVQEALATILLECRSYGSESVFLERCVGRLLAEEAITDRDAPPFDRVAMDGIAIMLGNIDNPLLPFYTIQGTQAAGMPQETLKGKNYCLEVMTGAVLPARADTVIPYEALRIIDGKAYPTNSCATRSNIHYQGTDALKGSTVLSAGKKLGAGDIGILATLGKWKVKVAKMPKVAVIATGNELVEVNEKPESYQIRKSNVYTIEAALLQDGIQPTMYHLPDTWDLLVQKLPAIISDHDVLLFSGGISKGKYDLIPKVLAFLGIRKHFQCVAQKPGKPFLFGKHPTAGTLVFAFPGNPVSTFVGYHYYFRQWLYRSMGSPLCFPLKYLTGPFATDKNLSLFIPVMLDPATGEPTPLSSNGSGDLFSLAKTQGFALVSKSGAETSSRGPFPFMEVV